ncbi:MAG: aspartate/glutamate racemase family protein [Candidatus Adiutrix sp.]|jgi:aspartate racemase|nr:aspartate/glutamate racemase family protein [Candidatus Adiutrix sp.]
MKTIGIIGGMSWESTAEYYRLMNTAVKERLGGLHSARCLIHSVEFAQLEAWMASGEWDNIAAVLCAAAQGLEAAGADFILIATNTMHKLADKVAAATRLPLLHIAETTAEALLAAGIKTAALLGTKATMEMDFYTKILEARGLTVLIPEAVDRDCLHRIIFEELCQGVISEDSRRVGLEIMNRLRGRGAEAHILGCTELGLLFRPQDTPVPLFDTARLHALAAVNRALE